MSEGTVSEEKTKTPKTGWTDDERTEMVAVYHSAMSMVETLPSFDARWDVLRNLVKEILLCDAEASCCERHMIEMFTLLCVQFSTDVLDLPRILAERLAAIGAAKAGVS